MSLILVAPLRFDAFATPHPILTEEFSQGHRDQFLTWFKNLPTLLQYELQLISFQKKDAASVFGMGTSDSSKASLNPSWDISKNIFYLYDFLPADSWDEQLESNPDAVAVHETRSLDPEAQRLLWRMRALIHAALGSLERRMGWAQTPEYLRINGWEKKWGKYRSLNQSVWGYARAEGQLTPSLDFVTFGERYFARAQGLRHDSRESTQSMYPIHPNDTLECQEFSRVRFFEQIFGKHPDFLGSAQPHCEAFEKFANLNSFSHFEVAFIEPSSAKPESIFGHLFIQPVYLNDGKPRAPFDNPGGQLVLDIGAVVPPQEKTFQRIIRGLSDGYPTVFDWGTLHQTILLQNEQEDRKIKFFKLNLSERENIFLFQRVWELQRRYELPYAFFPRNCGFFIGWIFSHILDKDWNYQHPQGLIVSPSAVLQSLANAHRSSKSLLEFGQPPLLAASQRMQSARQLARAAWHSLSLKLKPSLSLDPSMNLSAAIDFAFSADSRKRYLLYEGLIQTVEEQSELKFSESFQKMIFGLSVSEALRQTIAQKKLDEIDEDRILSDQEIDDSFSPRRYLAALQQNQETEAARNPSLTKLLEQFKLIQYRQKLARRPLSQSEKQDFEHREDTRLALYKLAKLSQLVSDHENKMLPVSLQMHEQAIASQRVKADRSNMRTGLYRTKFAFGTWLPDSGKLIKFGPRVRLIVLEELLGDEMALRMSDDISIQVGDVGLWALWTPSSDSGTSERGNAAPDLRFDLKVLDFKTLHQPLGLSALAQIHALHSSSEGRLSSYHLELFTGATRSFWQSKENSAHLFFEAGGFAAYGFNKQPGLKNRWQFGPQLNLFSRLPWGAGKEQRLLFQAKAQLNALALHAGESPFSTQVQIEHQLFVMSDRLLNVGLQIQNLHETDHAGKSIVATFEVEPLTEVAH